MTIPIFGGISLGAVIAVLFVLVLLWNTVAFTFLYLRRKQTGPQFPDVDPRLIRFNERWTSGCSQKKLRFSGGSRNALHVTVTESAVWLRGVPPFHIFDQTFDLLHRIEADRIRDLQRKRRWVFLDFETPEGDHGSVKLQLRDPSRFCTAIDNLLEAQQGS